MTTIIKLPLSVQIKYGLGSGPSNEYVPLTEYQELLSMHRELSDGSTKAIISLSEQRSELKALMQSLAKESYELKGLIRRLVKIGNELFDDPELSPNWHWKDYLMDLDKLVVDCKEAL